MSRFSLSETKNYQLLERIGRGRYSHVYNALNVTNNSSCVVKKLLITDVSKIKRELKYLDLVRSGPNIIQKLVSFAEGALRPDLHRNISEK